MDAGADDGPTLAGRRQRGRHKGADWCKDDRGIQPLWRCHVRSTGPDGAEASCKLLAGGVAWFGEGVDLLPAIPRHLSSDMRSRTEAVQAQSFHVPRHAQRAVADQSGAEQRRRLDVRKSRWNWEAEPLIRHRVVSVPAVDLVAGETGLVAHFSRPERQ